MWIPGFPGGIFKFQVDSRFSRSPDYHVNHQKRLTLPTTWPMEAFAGTLKENRVFSNTGGYSLTPVTTTMKVMLLCFGFSPLSWASTVRLKRWTFSKSNDRLVLTHPVWGSMWKLSVSFKILYSTWKYKQSLYCGPVLYHNVKQDLGLLRFSP